MPQWKLRTATSSAAVAAADAKRQAVTERATVSVYRATLIREPNRRRQVSHRVQDRQLLPQPQRRLQAAQLRCSLRARDGGMTRALRCALYCVTSSSIVGLLYDVAPRNFTRSFSGTSCDPMTLIELTSARTAMNSLTNDLSATYGKCIRLVTCM